MKALIKIFISILLVGTVNSLSAQCIINEVEITPELLGVCEGTSDTITFAGNGTCPGVWEYQVTTSSLVVLQPWSINDQYGFSPDSTDVLSVFARCTTCPSTIVSDTILIEVIPEPVIVADTFVCYGTNVNFLATGPDPGNMSWWDSESGGTQLSATPSYTSPPMTANDTVFMQVAGTVTSNTTQGSILITEAGLEGFPGATSADYVEISNLYANSVNTTGWVVAISHTYGNINTVNPIIWNLPSSFSPCSILSKTDVGGQTNYWGNNIIWASGQPGWVAVVDDVGNLVDFIAWGWTAAQIAAFNPTINGFSVTMGTQWSGNGCNSACQTTAGTPYSHSRTGNSDTDTAADFICQASSLNVLNPLLNCGWTTANITCPYPVAVVIDSLPSASAPDTTFLECYADIPVADPAIIIDEFDDHTIPPTVVYIGEVSDGNLCPETLTRTYRVLDSCANFIEVEHIIIIHDTVAPIMDPAPADVFVSCYSEIPLMVSLNWTDNCLGSGIELGMEVSSGTTCPEVLTRTWTVTDTCGNTATETQVITIFDTIAPVIQKSPADLSIQCYSDLPVMGPLNWTDNCDGNGVLNGVEISDGQTCPETIIRTWSIADGCGNTSIETQMIIINDITPPTASNLQTLQLPVLPPADISVVTDAADNCGIPVVEWVGDNTNNGFCPENVIRTYSVTDDCGNVTLVTRKFIIGDNIPDVSFTADPTILDDLSSGLVEFDNNTTGAMYYSWNFGDNSPPSNDFNPTHLFDNSVTTNYIVWLTATSEYGCVDSNYIRISVFQELLYFIPNAFTPDNDELNQTFKPIFTSGFNPNEYHFVVYNRWGETLFESYNHEVGWDGTFKGEILKKGTFVYKIVFGLEADDSREVISGNFILIR
ncbi:T9SS type B sorting domain-containing protein [Brumimicrobium glaciale]|uniref:T9SS type B sorting domain-containing protein n=1 Tax=Brumimicrobium glaciale TaxID=200475 RepID=A0A4Q4KNQ9_9FLAO|nr:T9SS type B sorting domain-containing protein [Brumimicrobium glaciale]RYM35093.1 T9SS type B sorting domain-containing protein [Brumimicrobium glaciale]